MGMAQGMKSREERKVGDTAPALAVPRRELSSLPGWPVRSFQFLYLIPAWIDVLKAEYSKGKESFFVAAMLLPGPGKK